MGLKLTVYDKTFDEIMQEIEDSDGVITPEQEAALEAWSKSEEAVIQICIRATEIEAEAKVLKEEFIQRAKENCERKAQTAGRLRALAREQMQAMGIRKLKSHDNLITISLRKNTTGRLEVGDESRLPEIYFEPVVVKKLRKDFLKAHLIQMAEEDANLDIKRTIGDARVVFEDSISIRVT